MRTGVVALVQACLLSACALAAWGDPPTTISINLSKGSSVDGGKSVRGAIAIGNKIVPPSEVESTIKRTGASFKTLIVISPDAEAAPESVRTVLDALEHLNLGYVEVRTRGTWVLERLAKDNPANKAPDTAHKLADPQR